MRFVSKNANLMVVLKPGLPGSHLTGQAPVTGIYVKFQNGIVEIKDEQMINQMKMHPAFNQDFIAVEEKDLDPFANTRSDIEPVHNIKELQFGHIVGGKKSVSPVRISPELQSFIEQQATNMAKAMLPGMMKEFMTKMKEEMSTTEESSEGVAAEEDEETEIKETIEETPKVKSKKGEVIKTPKA